MASYRMIRRQPEQVAGTEDAHEADRHVCAEHTSPGFVHAGPCKPDTGQVVKVHREEEHADTGHRRNNQRAEDACPLMQLDTEPRGAGVVDAEGDEAERDAQKTAVRPREAGDQSPTGRRDRVPAPDVMPRAEGGQQKQRLRVSRAEEDRERIGREQHQGVAGPFLAEKLTRQ